MKRGELQVTRKNGGGLLYPLTLGLFIALRLAGVTDWSWWWVLSPLWLAVVLAALAVGALFLTFALAGLYARIRFRSRLRQSFPEVFIDPTVWSRTPAAHQDDR